MIWEYERREVADRRFDAYLKEMADQGWELFYARRGKETRVARDPDFWEVIWKRPKQEAAAPSPAPTAASSNDTLH
jgi:hypothetical protein